MTKSAVITGAGSGIGRALAVQLAGQGWATALLDVRPEALEGAAEVVSAAGGAVMTGVADVADWSAVSGFAGQVLERFGPVDAVFCVAGVIHVGDVQDSDPGDLERVLRVNVLGSFITAKAFLPHLVASGGRLVFVSSAFGLFAAPGYGAYCASKFAVRALAESVRLELASAGQDVSVSCVFPGGVKTGIMQSGRYAAGVDRAGVVAAFEERVARTSPQEAAGQIIAGVRRGRRRIYVGWDARAVAVGERLTGGTAAWLLEALFRARRRRVT